MALATFDAAALADKCMLETVDSAPVGLVWPLRSDAERLMGVTARGPGDPKEAAGEP